MPHCNKQMLSFFLTTKCNLCCTYCYNAEERNKITEQTLSIDIAKAGIDWYFANNPSRHIRFYGPGEPTREFELMKNIVEYARKIGGDSVTTEIQTNGIFGEEIRKYCLNNFNIIWMSFDGFPKIQNKKRPLNVKYKEEFNDKTSAEILEENVMWLNNNVGNHKIMVGARVTMTEDNINEQKEMVKYFYDLGIRYVWTNPLFPAVGTKPVCDCELKKRPFDFDMESYIDNYIDAYKMAKELGVFWGSFLISNFDGESNINCRACTPAPHLTPDGYLSACDMVVLGKEPHHMEPFIFGKWSEDAHSFILNKDKIETLRRRSSDNIQHCQYCEARLHCGGYCLGEVLNETGKLDGQKPITCKAIKRLIREIGVFSEPYKYLHP